MTSATPVAASAARRCRGARSARGRSCCRRARRRPCPRSRTRRRTRASPRDLERPVQARDRLTDDARACRDQRIGRPAFGDHALGDNRNGVGSGVGAAHRPSPSASSLSTATIVRRVSSTLNALSRERPCVGELRLGCREEGRLGRRTPRRASSARHARHGLARRRRARAARR